MRIGKCYYCSSPLYPGHGSSFVRNDCKVFNFCRSKCRKNFKHKKNPRRLGWTKSFRKINGKELTDDPSFEFERRRHVPIKYNREKWIKVVEGLEQINEIRAKREGKYIMSRLNVDKTVTLEAAKFTVRKHINVIKSPAAGLKYKPKKSSLEDQDSTAESRARVLEESLKEDEDMSEDEGDRLQAEQVDQDESDDDESEDEIIIKNSGKKNLENASKILEEGMETDDDDPFNDDDDSEESDE